jgi:hypothetical protein
MAPGPSPQSRRSKLLAQRDIGIANLVQRVRTAVIVSHDSCDSEVRSRHYYNASVVMVIHHGERSTGRIFPIEQRRKLRRSTRIVYADLEKSNPIRSQR